MSTCNIDCGRVTVENDQVICENCGKNYGHLIDILDHARLRDEAEAKLAEAQAREAQVKDWFESYERDLERLRGSVTWKKTIDGALMPSTISLYDQLFNEVTE